MKITVLVENTTSNADFIAEHGLSLLINSNEKTILFDCGQTDAFIKNAKTLGVDLSQVDFLILSHGHYDHGGGLKDFLKINKKATLYLPQNAFDGHYNGVEKYIGLNTTLLDENRIVIVDDQLKIADGIVVKRLKKEPFKVDSAGLTVKVGNEGVRGIGYPFVPMLVHKVVDNEALCKGKVGVDIGCRRLYLHAFHENYLCFVG